MPDADRTGEPLPLPDNGALVAAMRAYEDGPAPDRQAVLQLLLNASLHVPLARAPGPDSRVADVACPYTDREGNRLLAAFTDLEALRRMDLPPGTRLYTASVPALCQMAIVNGAAGLLLNPKGPFHFTVSREEAEALAQGKLPDRPGRIDVAGKAMRVVCPLDRPPDAVLDEIRIALELNGIETAYWCETQMDGDRPRFSVALDPWSDEISGKVLPLVEAAWSRYKPLDGRFLLVPLNSGFTPDTPPPGAPPTLRAILESYDEGALLFRSGHQGYLRYVRAEDTLDGWHSFQGDSRLLPAPEPPSNDALARALEGGFRTQNQDHAAIHAGLLGSRLLVPVHRPPEGMPVPPCLELVIFTPQGQRCLLGMTDEATFRKSFPRHDHWWVALPAERLCRMVCEGRYAGLWLMGGDQPGYIMGLLECDAVGRGTLPSEDGGCRVDRPMRMAFGLPKLRPPEAFLDGLRRAADRGGAEEVYWTFMSLEMQPVHMALGIRPCTRELSQALGAVIRGLIDSHPGVTPYIDFLDLDHQPGVRQNGELLYRRPKRFGLWGKR